MHINTKYYGGSMLFTVTPPMMFVCAVAKTISVACLEHSNRHEAFDLGLLLFTSY